MLHPGGQDSNYHFTLAPRPISSSQGFQATQIVSLHLIFSQDFPWLWIEHFEQIIQNAALVFIGRLNARQAKRQALLGTKN